MEQQNNPANVIKRSGERVAFDAARIKRAITKAGAATGEFGTDEAGIITAQAVKVLAYKFPGGQCQSRLFSWRSDSEHFWENDGELLALACLFS